VAFEEILSLSLATGGGVEMVVETVLDFTQQEVTGVNLAVNAQLGVRHRLSK
jgi:hypothetical protein